MQNLGPDQGICTHTKKCMIMHTPGWDTNDRLCPLARVSTHATDWLIS